MIKILIFLIFMYQIVDANLLQFYNFSMNPELSQPSGSINYNNILFIKNSKRYTTFEIEKISSNDLCHNSFGFSPLNDLCHNNFGFSPLNDFCHNSFEKNITINCLKKYPNQWWCIYENCISLSRYKFNNFIIEKQFELPFAH